MKSHLLIQLVFNGRAIWQVKQDVPNEHCRRMTPAELKTIGTDNADLLARMADDFKERAAAPDTPRKKR